MSYKVNGIDLGIPPGVIIASATHTTDPNGYVIANGSLRTDTSNEKYGNLINLGIGTNIDKRYLSYQFEGNAYNTGSKLDGTLYGTATYNSSIVKRGTYSLLLNSSSYVSIPTLYLNSFRNGITIAFWFYRTSAGTQSIFSFKNGSTTVESYFFGIGAIYNLYFNVGTSQVYYAFNTLNTWSHFVVTLTYTSNDTSTCALYVNGTFQSSSIANMKYPTETDYNDNTIGNTTGTSMIGHLDDFNIYNGVLSAADISNLYNTGVGAVSVQPYLSYQFEQNIVNTGTYLNGTISGTATYDSSIVKRGTYSLLSNSSSYISIPFLPMLRFRNGGLSIAFWFYRTSTGNGDYVRFTNGISTLLIQSLSSGNLFTIYFTINSTTAAYSFSSINVWNHFAVTLTYTANNTSVCKLYADGVLQSTSSANMSYPTEAIGPYTDNKIGQFSGYLDDFNIYNGLLSDSEVTSLYNNKYGGYLYTPPNLSAAFLRGTGSQIINSSSYTGPSAKSFQHYAIQEHNHTGSSSAHTHTTNSTASTTGADGTSGIIGMGGCNSYNTEATTNGPDEGQVNVFDLYDVTFNNSSASITVSNNTGDSNENAPFCYGINWLIKL